MKERFFLGIFFQGLLALVLELELRKLIFSDESRFSSVLNFNAGHLGGKKVTLNASNLELRRTKSQNRNL